LQSWFRPRVFEGSAQVPVTYADIAKAKELLGYEPKVTFDTGIRNFVAWLRSQLAQRV
jgi:UDP-glucuronate 4-epimerase